MTSPIDRGTTDELAARYGRPSKSRRNAGIALIALAGAVLLLWVVWAAVGQSRDRVTGLVESFDVRSPHAVAVTVQISRSSTEPAQCTIEAIASDHSVVGQRVVRLPVGATGTQTVSRVVRTEREATAADVTGCR